MEVIYFHKEPKLNGYYFHRRTNFEHGVQFWFDEDNYMDAYIDFLIPLVSFLVRTYGEEPGRYELVFSQEDTMYRVYFKDEADQVACKMHYHGEWDPDPVWGDEEDEDE